MGTPGVRHRGERTPLAPLRAAPGEDGLTVEQQAWVRARGYFFSDNPAVVEDELM